MKYVDRLKSCGFSDAEAVRTTKDFLKNFGEKGLEEYIEDLENVDKVQCQSHCEQCRRLRYSCGCSRIKY